MRTRLPGKGDRSWVALCNVLVCSLVVVIVRVRGYGQRVAVAMSVDEGRQRGNSDRNSVDWARYIQPDKHARANTLVRLVGTGLAAVL